MYILVDYYVIEIEFGAFKTIENNYTKYVLTMDKLYNNTSDEGIKIKYLIDFLLE